MINSWVLFLKENGRVGVLPENKKKCAKGEVLDIVEGTFKDACDYAKRIETQMIKE